MVDYGPGVPHAKQHELSSCSVVYLLVDYFKILNTKVFKVLLLKPPMFLLKGLVIFNIIATLTNKKQLLNRFYYYQIINSNSTLGMKFRNYGQRMHNNNNLNLYILNMYK